MIASPSEPRPLPPVSRGERFAAAMLALLVAGTVALWWGEPLLEPSAFIVFLGDLQNAWQDTLAILRRLDNFSADSLDALLFTAYASSLFGLIVGWLLLFPFALARAAGRLPGWVVTMLWWLTLTHGAMALYCLVTSFPPGGHPDPWREGWVAWGTWLIGKLLHPSLLAFLVPAFELPLAAAVLWFTRAKRRSDSAGEAEARESG